MRTRYRRNAAKKQNRIDYIVFGNKKGATRFLYQQGYYPPKNTRHLSEAIKELVQKKGTSIVPLLLKYHPDAALILKAHKPVEKKEDSYCGSCNHDSYDNELNYCGSCGYSNFTAPSNAQFKEQIKALSDAELERQYEAKNKKYQTNPNTPKLAEEIQALWRERSQRNATKNKKHFLINPKYVFLISVGFAAGALFGSGITKS